MANSEKPNFYHMGTEERLELLNALLANTLEYAIIALDLAGNITLWNEGAQHIYRYTAEDVLGKHINLLQDPVDIQSGKIASIFNDVKRDGKWEGEIKRIAKGGDVLDIFYSIYLRKNSQGSPVGFLLISRSLSKSQQIARLLLKHVESEEDLQNKNKALEEMSRRAQEASRQKSEFIANVSHELRTPLNAVIGFTEMLYDDVIDFSSPKYKESLGDVLTSARQLLLLINDVLDLAKVESGRMEFFPEYVDIEKMLREAQDIFHNLSSKKQIQVTAHIDKNLSNVIIDPTRFKQILYNFVSNALKFTPHGGKVDIRVVAKPNNLFRLEIKDSGIGIREEDIHKLFSNFTQLDASSAKKYAGTGLGLALTKKIVEAQDGQVGVYSVFGQGSTFYAELPCTPIPKNSGLFKLPKAEHKDSKKVNILLIEDSVADVRLLREYLREVDSAHFILHVASSIAEGLRIIATNNIEVIIMDLNLPDEQGLGSFQKVYKFANNIPIIIMSVLKDKQIIYEAMQEGAQNYLVKGEVDSDLLMRAIQSAIWGSTGQIE